MPTETQHTVLVTGGSRGIGKCIVEQYRSMGYTVLAPTRHELDMADSQSVARFAQSSVVRDVDILVNNAAENVPSPLSEIELERWQHALDVNLTAPLLLTQYLGSAMAQRGWGRIVNISSVYSMVSRARRVMYTTNKAAVNGLTKSSAVELGPRNVLVNAVCPGFVDTDLTRQNNTPEEIARLCAQVPLGRLASSEEIAELVIMLGSEQNSYITGQLIAIDGGFLCQ